jgi:hypothetical protein
VLPDDHIGISRSANQHVLCQLHLVKKHVARRLVPLPVQFDYGLSAQHRGAQVIGVSRGSGECLGLEVLGAVYIHAFGANGIARIGILRNSLDICLVEFRSVDSI